jgi:hypothetical protein
MEHPLYILKIFFFDIFFHCRLSLNIFSQIVINCNTWNPVAFN